LADVVETLVAHLSRVTDLSLVVHLSRVTDLSLVGHLSPVADLLPAAVLSLEAKPSLTVSSWSQFYKSVSAVIYELNVIVFN
jgi:hypothetical protein